FQPLPKFAHWVPMKRHGKRRIFVLNLINRRERSEFWRFVLRLAGLFGQRGRKFSEKTELLANISIAKKILIFEKCPECFATIRFVCAIGVLAALFILQ